MDARTMPPAVWFMMAQKARLLSASIQAMQKDPAAKEKLETQKEEGESDFERAAAKRYLSIANASDDLTRRVLYQQLKDFFEENIYYPWARDFQNLKYLPNEEFNTQDWAYKAEEIRHMGSEAAQATNQATPWIQTTQPDEKGEVDHNRTRMGERYSGQPSSRIQFLVNCSGGLTLYNQMKAVNHKALREMRDFPVQAWKCFADKSICFMQESCVIYLKPKKLSDPAVERYIKYYLWPALQPSLDKDYAPIGLHKVANKPVWGLQDPDPEKWELVFAGESFFKNSAAHVISHIMTLSFIEVLETDFDENEETQLISRAQKANSKIIEQLYGMPAEQVYH